MKGGAKEEGKFQGGDVHRTQYESDKRVYEHSDAPTDLFSNTVTSAARFDGSILVVSVADGPMPQTREHFLHARQAGVPCIVDAMEQLDLKFLKIDDAKKKELAAARKLLMNE